MEAQGCGMNIEKGNNSNKKKLDVAMSFNSPTKYLSFKKRGISFSFTYFFAVKK